MLAEAGSPPILEITGLAHSTINRGEDDLDAEPPPRGRSAGLGGGRPALREIDPTLVDGWRRLVESATLGDPMRPLIWVSKSLDKLAAELTAMGHPISAIVIASEFKRLPIVH